MGIKGFLRGIFEEIVAQAIWATAIQGGIALFISTLLPFFLRLPLWQKVLLGIALFFIILGGFLGILHSVKQQKQKKKTRNKELINARMPYLKEITKTLAEINNLVSKQATAISHKEVSSIALQKCNDYYVEQVKQRNLKYPIKYPKLKDMKSAFKIIIIRS